MPFISSNPATGEILAEYPVASAAELEARLGTAGAAFRTWRATSIEDRALVMTRAAELIESEIPVIGEMLTREMGKTFAAAKGEASKCALAMRYFAQNAARFLAPEAVAAGGRRSGVRFDPVGPILAIMPWNFPLWQVVRFGVPTIMAGNVVLLKHAPNVPTSAQFLEDLFTRSGFPAGVLTNLFVEVDIVGELIADPRVAGVTLTGSERAGRSVASLAGAHLKKCVLELGGSDPFVVAAHADLDLAVSQAVIGRIQNNGQACIAAKRFIVVRDRADEFLDRFAAAMAAVRTGDPMDPEVELGPLVSRPQLDQLAAQVASSVAAGAVVRTGGSVLDRPGFYYAPTVLSDVPADSRAGCEELFGPVATVNVADDLEHAIALANDSPWGLGGSIWSTDDAEIDQAIEGLECGVVFANGIVASMPELPFGGTKNSGFGRELSVWGVREFTNVKSFHVS
ncbi:MAG: NAD-dependent succinate-semialdehyde dehydrogenase [Acidimicrobiales bacterium]